MKLALLICAAALAFHPESCPVVLVKGQGGEPLRINKDDYDADPSAWELFDEAPTAPAAVAPTAPAAVAPAAPVQMVVSKIGRGDSAKFFVTDMEKNKVTGVAGIDEAGYADEGSAWQAVTAIAVATGAANG